VSLFGLRRKSPEQANRELLESLAAQRVDRFTESKRSPLEPHERAWFETGAIAASLVAERMRAEKLKERAARALDELLTMPLISFWHWQQDRNGERSKADGAEARATDFRHLQVAYSDLQYGVETVRENAQELLNDALALDWQFAEEMGSTQSSARKSVYEGLLAEKAVAILAGIESPLCGGMGLPVSGLGELLDRREDRAGFTAALEYTPAIRAGLSKSFDEMERRLGETPDGESQAPEEAGEAEEPESR
jgi:hypothetical protein